VSFRSRLRRLRRELAANPDSEVPSQELRTDPDPFIGDKTDAGAPRDLQPFDTCFGPGLARTTLFPASYLHGQFPLSEVGAAQGQDLVLLTGDASLEQLDLEGAVYLDTETTGLSGGAGTYVFLVGLGRFIQTEQGSQFEVWQGFLPGPEGEPALLEESAARVRASSGVVSFFGKSFDRHRLEDKMTLCQVPAPFDDALHLDLYHPCRRLYRGAYADGRLKTMEAQLCGVQREDDLPGALAPEAWFDYLGERAHRLEGVFRHNLDDVLSLVGLASHLGRSQLEVRESGTSLSGDPATRALGLARSFGARLEREQALVWMERALERGAEPQRALLREQADLLRLAPHPERAMEAYRALVASAADAHSVPCLLELAKLLEHQARDVQGAMECCRVAEDLLDANHTGQEHARLTGELKKRLERLSRKLA
jgi:uncharacterized protein YprB with RNaseH-like and TPR domain